MIAVLDSVGAEVVGLDEEILLVIVVSLVMNVLVDVGDEVTVVIETGCSVVVVPQQNSLGLVVVVVVTKLVTGLMLMIEIVVVTGGDDIVTVIVVGFADAVTVSLTVVVASLPPLPSMGTTE